MGHAAIYWPAGRNAFSGNPLSSQHTRLRQRLPPESARPAHRRRPLSPFSTATSAPSKITKSRDAAAACTAYVASPPPPLPPSRRVSLSTTLPFLILPATAGNGSPPTRSAAVASGGVIMAAQGSLFMWRAVFAALGVLMVATLVYTCATDGSPFRPELFTPWMVATLVDFYVNIFAISAWVIYKEANWISSAVWVVLLCCFGSAATCAYIVKKLFEVTSVGSSQDPLDLLFIRQGNLSQRKCSYVIIGRIVFSILGIFMAAVVTYTVVTDGLPFRKELLTPWMAATLIDFYINVFAISVWVSHKESSWISTTVWIVLLICFGSITTCGYITLQLFQVSYQDPLYHVLLNSHSKKSCRKDGRMH